ncbi:MAG: endonuclease [Prevotellaceae bacterium]|jgi:predicted extracellular nuclease|nr:endonuclease [Prevotellaceae bacterium]
MNLLLKIIIIAIIFLKSNEYIMAQTSQFKVMFFNTENYFDSFDDPKTLDDDFTPTGSYHWTWNRFLEKRDALAKIIIAVGEGKIPSIVGLCEIENRFVLNQLVNETPLAKFNYRIVHRDSPDTRGIDVALLYNPADFELLYQNFYQISKSFKTREILYAKGIFCGADTLHIFVNHFPSKRGGAKTSEPRRTAAAIELKRLCDSLLSINKNANILAMGDFNDTPNSEPIVKTLQAKDNFDEIIEHNLYNLAMPLMKKGDGTIKYQGVWEFIDLMFVSGNMLNDENKISCSQSDFNIFKAPYLFEKDNTFVGEKPKRTYIGMKYNGGISDHLPVYIRLKIKVESF